MTAVSEQEATRFLNQLESDSKAGSMAGDMPTQAEADNFLKSIKKGVKFRDPTKMVEQDVYFDEQVPIEQARKFISRGGNYEDAVEIAKGLHPKYRDRTLYHISQMSQVGKAARQKDGLSYGDRVARVATEAWDDIKANVLKVTGNDRLSDEDREFASKLVALPRNVEPAIPDEMSRIKKAPLQALDMAYGQAGPAALGIATGGLTKMAGGGKMAVAAAGRLAHAAGWTAQIYPDREQEYKAAGMEPDLAKNAALLSSAAEAAIEGLNIVPFGPQGTAKAVVFDSVLQAVKRGGKRYAKGVAIESLGEETAQAITDGLIKAGATRLSDQAPDTDLSKILPDAIKQGVDSILPVALMMAPGHMAAGGAKMIQGEQLKKQLQSEQGPATIMAALEQDPQTAQAKFEAISKDQPTRADFEAAGIYGVWSAEDRSTFAKRLRGELLRQSTLGQPPLPSATGIPGIDAPIPQQQAQVAPKSPPPGAIQPPQQPQMENVAPETAITPESVRMAENAPDELYQQSDDDFMDDLGRELVPSEPGPVREPVPVAPVEQVPESEDLSALTARQLGQIIKEEGLTPYGAKKGGSKKQLVAGIEMARKNKAEGEITATKRIGLGEAEARVRDIYERHRAIMEVVGEEEMANNEEEDYGRRPGYSFPDNFEGRSSYKELLDLLPPHWDTRKINEKIRLIPEGGSYRPDGNDVMINIGPDAMAQSIVDYDAQETDNKRPFETTAAFVEEHPEQFSAADRYAIAQWRMINSSAESAALAQGKTPETIDTSALNEGDTMEIAGEHNKVTQVNENTGKVTIQDGGPHKLPEGLDIQIDEGTLKQPKGPREVAPQVPAPATEPDFVKPNPVSSSAPPIPFFVINKSPEIPDGGRLVSSKIVMRNNKSNTAYRFGIIENEDGGRYVSVEREVDERGSFSRVDVRFVEVDTSEIESDRWVNNQAAKYFKEDKAIESDETFNFGANAVEPEPDFPKENMLGEIDKPPVGVAGEQQSFLGTGDRTLDGYTATKGGFLNPEGKFVPDVDMAAERRMARENAETGQMTFTEHATTPPATESTPMAGATAPFVAAPAETESGKTLLRRLQSDKEGKVGRRSIVEHMNKLVQAKMMVTKSQTGKKHPAIFRPGSHMIFTRAGQEDMNYHEAGHAMSYLMTERSPGWREAMEPDLVKLAKAEGSWASAETSEEGMAELVRRYIADYASIPSGLRTKFEQALQKASPEILAGLRDSHRAYAYHMSRPGLDRYKSDNNDRPAMSGIRSAANDMLWWSMNQVVGNSMIRHRMYRRAVKAITGPIRADKQYRSQLNLAEKFLDEIKDTGADVQSAYQSRLRTVSEAALALGGTKRGKEGIRVLATDRNSISDAGRKALTDAGFNVPAPAKHGYFIWLHDESFAAIRHKVGIKNWANFEIYGQRRAALERYEKGGQEYPGLHSGETPDVVQGFLAEMERDHPDWKDRFKDVQKFMDQLLLVPVLSGEKTIKEAVAMKEAWTDYWPLPRQVENRPAKGGGGAMPSSGIKGAHGSSLPFRSLEEAVNARVRQAFDAYYTNRLMLAVRDFGKSLATMGEDAKRYGQRLMIPLNMDMAKVATLGESEQKEMLADGINKLMGMDIAPEEISISLPGKPIFRAIAPKMVHVIAPFENGQRSYYLVPDPLNFDMLSKGNDPHRYLKWATDSLAGAVKPMKRILTTNPAFPVWNTLVRDPINNVFMGEGKQAFIQWSYLAMGMVNRLTGKAAALDLVSRTELLSKSLDVVTSDAHQSAWERFKEVAGEGIVHDNYGEMDWSGRLKVLPEQVFSTLLKPLDILFYVFGSRRMAQAGEALPREGAYAAAIDRGESPERAQIAYDYISGNFGQQQANSTFAAIMRTAIFVNPGLQIFGAQVEKMTDPNPKRAAFNIGIKLPWIAAMGGVAAAANWLIIGDDEDKKEQMRERPDKDRMGYMSIGGWLRMPFEYGVLGAFQSFGFNAIEGMLLDDPVNADTMAKEILRRASDLPVPADMVSPYYKTASELYRNHNDYFDQDIIPKWLQRKFPNNPEMQYFPTTPEIYKRIGAGLKVSPLYLRHGVQSILTREFEGMLLAIDRGFGDEMADVPLIGRLFTRESKGWRSQSVQDVMDLDEAYDSLRNQGKLSSPDILKKYEAAHRGALNIERLWAKAKEARASGDKEASKNIEREMTAQARKFISEFYNKQDYPVQTKDMVSKARKLLMNKPDKKDKRTEWQSDIDASIAWFKDRGVKKNDIVDTYYKSTEGKYTHDTRAAKKKKLRSMLTRGGVE